MTSTRRCFLLLCQACVPRLSYDLPEWLLSYLVVCRCVGLNCYLSSYVVYNILCCKKLVSALWPSTPPHRSPRPTRQLQQLQTCPRPPIQTASRLEATRAPVIPRAAASACRQGSGRKPTAACAAFQSLGCHYHRLAGGRSQTVQCRQGCRVGPHLHAVEAGAPRVHQEGVVGKHRQMGI